MRNNKTLIISIFIFSILYINNVNAISVEIFSQWHPNEANLDPTLNEWREEDVLNPHSSFTVNLLLDMQYGENYSKYFNELNFSIDPMESASTPNITNISVKG